MTWIRYLIRRLVFDRLTQLLGLFVGLAATFLFFWLWMIALALPAPSLPVAACAVLMILATGIAAQRISLRFETSLNQRQRNLSQVITTIEFSVIILSLSVAAVLTLMVFLLSVFGFAPQLPGMHFSLLQLTTTSTAMAIGAWLIRGIAAGLPRIRVRRLDVDVEGLQPELDGFQIAHLSDLHIGNGVASSAVDKIVEKTNALKPDVVAITGDIFDRSPFVVRDGARSLSALEAEYGVYAVLGNHDLYTGRDLVVEELRNFAPRLRVLRMGCESIQGLPLAIAGTDDPIDARGRDLGTTERIVKLARAMGDDPTILLMHRPDGFITASEQGFCLMLSGHYHGGQLALPGWGGRLNAARLFTTYDRGIFRNLNSTLFVSRGIGVTGPRVRLNSDPEIAVIRLRSSPRRIDGLPDDAEKTN